MFGKGKRNRRQEDRLWEEGDEYLQEDAYPEDSPEEYAEEYAEDDSEAVYDDGFVSSAMLPEDDLYGEEEEEKPEPRSMTSCIASAP